MSYPKIIYNVEGLGDQTLTFSFPPVEKAGADLVHEKKANREDTISVAGLKQSWFLHTDNFRTLQMNFVPIEDLVSWETFIDFALEGHAFDYYPDASQPEFVSYTLDDTDWKPAYSQKGVSAGVSGLQKFTLKLRKEVSDDSSS